jgi:hypothetical protein
VEDAGVSGDDDDEEASSRRVFLKMPRRMRREEGPKQHTSTNGDTLAIFTDIHQHIYLLFPSLPLSINY